VGKKIQRSGACGDRRADPGVRLREGCRQCEQGIGRLDVDYPVAIDNDYGIWRAFDNEAWPAFYFIGADGRVRNRVFGEGGYDESERLIQQLLSEANGAPVASAIAPIEGKGPEAAADESDLRSDETYIGYDQARNFVSPGGAGEDAPSIYRPVSPLLLNHWSLTGAWTIGGEFATLNDAPGGVAYRFHARDLNLVLAAPLPRQLHSLSHEDRWRPSGG
jgi:hypothetical protein